MSRGFLLFARLIAVCSLFLVAGCGPFLLLPGGKLDGKTTVTPDDWSLIDDVNTVQLETRPQDPYSVNIWAVAMGPALYLHAGANRSAWVEHIEADPAVRIRIGDKLYDLRATRVTDLDEFARFADAYEQKFGMRPRNEDVTEVYVFRIRTDLENAPGW